ncbi:MAG: alpha/beta hydrolase, partial [Myxococcaceae bacterium]|nr:alpha/beta hydrolase [Myxococcaceae bacterium]
MARAAAEAGCRRARTFAARPTQDDPFCVAALLEEAALRIRTLWNFCMIITCLALAMGLALASRARAEPAGCESGYITACSGVPYGPFSESTYGDTQRLDLFKPLGSGPFPVIVFVHGGAWTGSNRSLGPAAQDWLGVLRQLSRGYAVVSVDYRYATDQRPFAEPVRDVTRAIRWLKRNAAEYQLDATRMALWGHSAGAHIAALIGATSEQKTFDERFPIGHPDEPLNEFDSRTSLVIGFGGVYDFRQDLSWG